MKFTNVTFVAFLIISALFAVAAGLTQVADRKSALSDNVAELLGDWSGQSICVNKEKFPACNDEKVVYHITRVADKANTVNLSADKIVNGKPEFMGAFDFIYDPAKKTLTSDYKTDRVHLLLEFVVKDDVLEGAITSLPEKMQVRQIKVTKDK